jgi:hypothetical protein
MGALGRNTKSKSHPSLNLVNRYLQSAGVHRSNVFAQGNGVLDADNEADENDVHPLVPLGPVHSRSNLGSHRMVWRKMTPATSTWLHRMHSPLAKPVERRLRPWLGREICERHARAQHHFSAQSSRSPVQIGPWTFRPTPSHHQLHESGTCNSWFSIERKYVPHHVEEIQAEGKEAEANWDGDELLYGKLHSFIEIKIPCWTKPVDDSVHHIAECTLWETVWTEPATGLIQIDLEKPLCLNQNKHHISFVPMHRIAAQVAIAPRVVILVDAPEATKRAGWYVLPLPV